MLSIAISKEYLIRSVDGGLSFLSFLNITFYPHMRCSSSFPSPPTENAIKSILTLSISHSLDLPASITKVTVQLLMNYFSSCKVGLFPFF